MKEQPAADGDWVGAGGLESALPKEVWDGLNEGDGDPDSGMDLADDRVDSTWGVQAEEALHAEEGAPFS